MNITRRQALKVAIAGALTPVVLNAAVPVESEYVNLSDFEPKPYGDPHEWSPQQVCHLFAGWELAAQQRNRPRVWRRLRYAGAFQWNDGTDGREPLIAWYGIGPATWTADKQQELIDWLTDDCDNPVLATERVARGRAFAIVSVGSLSKRLRHELAKPACKRERLIKLLEA